MDRRSVITGILGVLAAPIAWLGESREQKSPVICHSHPTGTPRDMCDYREVCEKTPHGLQTIEWEEIVPGDEIVLIDWDLGRIQRILHMGTVVSLPDFSKPGHPVVFDRAAPLDIDCVRP